MLGIDLSRVRVHADEEGARVTRAVGARGATDGASVWLDPQRVDARTAGGRYVVAHELAHVAQGDERRWTTGRAGSLLLAEWEADRVATAVVEGRARPRVQATLPRHTTARDTGREDLRRLLDSLDAEAATAYERELLTIREAFSAEGAIDGAGANVVVATLAGVPVAVAEALVHSLDPVMRANLVAHLTGAHAASHRPVVLACLAALDPFEVAALDKSLLSDLDLKGLDEWERNLLLVALPLFSDEVLNEVLADEKKGPPLREVMRGEAISITDVAVVELRADLQVRTEKAKAARSKEQADARKARVGRVRALVDKKEGTQALDEAVGTAEADGDERRLVVADLEREGYVVKLIELLDDNDGESGPLITPAFTALMHARSTGANLATVDDRLSGGIFGWDWTEDIAITEADALVAFHALAALPLDVRERLLRTADPDWSDKSDQGDVLDKMERNLPEWFVVGPAYRSLAVDRDAKGGLVERGQQHADAWNRPGSAGLLIDVRRLISDGELTKAFERLVAAESAVRAAVVDRLDALDVMDGFLEDLPDELRLGKDHRLQLLHIAAARSVPNLLRHIDSLLRVDLWTVVSLTDWAVRSWEADLAMVQFRALPAYEQQRFPRLDAITSQLSGDQQLWAGTNLLSAKSSQERLDAVRKQLADGDLWKASHAARLRAVVNMAVALGDRRSAFDASKRFDAYRNAALKPVVDDFRLYDPDAKRETYKEEQLENQNLLHDFWNDVVANIPIVGWLLYGLPFIAVAVKGFATGNLAINPWTNKTQGKDLPLRTFQTILGGNLGPTRLSDPEKVGTPGEADTINRPNFSFTPNTGALHLDIPRLELDGLGLVKTDWAMSVGRVSARNVVIDGTFDPTDLTRPRQITVHLDGVDLHDLLMTTSDSMNGLARAHLAPVDLTATSPNESEQVDKPPNFLMYIPVLGPILEWMRLAWGLKTLATKGGGQLAGASTRMRDVQLDIGSITLEGLSSGVEQVTFEDVHVGWGGDHLHYLARLQVALRRRLGLTTGEEREKVQKQLDEVLASQNLIERWKADPTSVTKAELAEVRRLQDGPGGIVVDTGAITLTGLGDKLDRLTVDHLRGQMTSSGLSAGPLEDADLVKAFKNAGPPGSLRRRLDDSAGQFSVGDVKARLMPPSSATLARRQMDALFSKGPSGSRFFELEEALKGRRELDRLLEAREARRAAGASDDAAASARIEELMTKLAGWITAEGVELTADAGKGSLTAGAKRITGGNLDFDQVGVGGFEVTGVRVPIHLDEGFAALSRITEDPTAVQTVGGERAKGEEAPLHVDKATVDRLRIGEGDNEIDKIVVTNLRGGRVSKVSDGWAIEDIGVESIELAGISYDDGTRSLQAPGTVALRSISLNATVVVGPGGVTGGRIDHLRINEIAVLAPVDRPTDEEHPPLRFTDKGLDLDVKVFGGSLGTVVVRQLAIDVGDAVTIRTTDPVGTDADPKKRSDAVFASVDKIDALKLVARIGAHQVKGTIQSTGEAVPSISAGFATSGGYFIDLMALRLVGGEYRSPDGFVRIRQAKLEAGRIGIDKDRLALEGFVLPLIELGDIEWKIGAHGKLTTRGVTRLEGVGFTTNLISGPKAGGKEGETELHKVEVPDARIGRITADEIRYVDGPIDVHVKRLSPNDAAPLDINNIEVHGLDWQKGKGLTKAEISSGPAFAALSATKDGGKDWGFLGRASAHRLSFELTEAGKTTIIGEKLSANGALNVGTKVRTDLDLFGLDAMVEIEGDWITVSGPSTKKLGIGRVELSDFHIDTPDLKLGTSGPKSKILLENLTAVVKLRLGEVNGKREIVEVLVPEVDLTKLTADALDVTLDGGIHLGVSKGVKPSVVEGVHVKGLRFTRAMSPRVTGTPEKWSDLAFSSFDEVVVDRIDLRDVTAAVPLTGRGGPSAPTPGAPTKDDWINAFAPVLDRVNGHVNLDLQAFDVEYVPYDPEFHFKLGIHKGEVNFRQIEKGFGVLDTVLDFEVRKRVLVLEAVIPLVSWDLGTPAEAAKASVLHTTRLFRLAKPRSHLSSSGKPSETDIEVSNLDIFLNVSGDRPFVVTLPNGGDIKLPANALDSLRIDAGLGIPRRRSSGLPIMAAINFGVDALRVDSIRDMVLSFGVVNTNSIRLIGVRNGRLNIQREASGKGTSPGIGNFDPVDLSGTFEQLEIKRLVVKPPSTP